jgi:hypothetical protein
MSDDREWERQQAMAQARELRMRQAGAKPYVAKRPGEVEGLAMALPGDPDRRCSICRRPITAGQRYVERPPKAPWHFPPCNRRKPRT